MPVTINDRTRKDAKIFISKFDTQKPYTANDLRIFGETCYREGAANLLRIINNLNLKASIPEWVDLSDERSVASADDVEKIIVIAKENSETNNKEAIQLQRQLFAVLLKSGIFGPIDKIPHSILNYTPDAD